MLAIPEAAGNVSAFVVEYVVCVCVCVCASVCARAPADGLSTWPRSQTGEKRWEEREGGPSEGGLALWKQCKMRSPMQQASSVSTGLQGRTAGASVGP